MPDSTTEKDLLQEEENEKNLMDLLMNLEERIEVLENRIEDLEDK